MGEIIVPILMLIISAIFFISADKLPVMAGTPMTSGTFPKVLSVILGMCGSTAVAFAETTMITGSPLDDETDQSLYDDTLKAGMGTVSPKLVEVLVRDCGDRVRDLQSYGLDLQRRVYTELSVSGFAHSTPRTYIVKTRMEHNVLAVLEEQVRKRPIRLCEQVQVARLIVEDGRAVGAVGFRQDGGIVLFRAGAVILAGGGAHGLFPHHPSTGEMIGDSLAMCYHAGLTMVNMEFLQIGYMSTAPIKRILSAPIWRLRPSLTNAAGEDVLEKRLPKGVSSDDVFSTAEFPYTVRSDYRYLHQAIYEELIAGRAESDAITLDVSKHNRDAIARQAPFTYQVFRSAGLDLAVEKLPISIGVQTFHGGCLMNEQAESELKSLYVCGEAAGGLMGAERPGGNALAECQVFGNIAGIQAAATSQQAKRMPDDLLIRLADHTLDQAETETSASFAETIKALRALMFRSSLTVRNGVQLSKALTEIQRLRATEAAVTHGLKDRISAANALTSAELIIASALERKDSRGGHFRTDYPNMDDTYNCSVCVQKLDGRMQLCLKNL